MDFHWQQAITDKRVIGASIAGVTAGTDHRADVTEVASDFRVQTTNADSALFHVRSAQQHIHQLLHFTTHLLCQLAGLDHVVFQQIATNPADQVQAVGFTRTGKDLCHFHGGFTHAEELHKAGVEAGKVAGETEVEQMRVQAFHLQQNGADHLRTFWHLNTHRVFYRRGVGGAVGKAADPAHTVREEGHFVVTHTGFRQFFHAAMNVEQTVVGVDNVFAIDEQTEVARFVRSDVQRTNRHDVVFLVAQFVDELVGFSIGGRCRTLTIIHAVFTQRIKFIRPVIRQHQTTFIRQTNRNQTVHIAHFTLAPHRRRNARRHGRILRFVGVNFDANRYPTLGALLHRQHVINGVMTIQFAFVVTKKHRQPAPLLVVEKLHHFRQIVHLYGDSQLIFGLPGVVQHDARKCLIQRGEIMLT